MLEVQEQVELIGGRWHELAMVQVEGSSDVISCVDEQGPDPHVVCDPDRSTDRIDEKASPESSIPLRGVDGKAGQQQAGDLGRYAPFGQLGGGVGPLYSSGRECVVADHAVASRRHEDSSVS